MGNVTDDMSKLSREVLRSRKAREAFVNGLEEGVSEMLADFGNSRTEMANKMDSEHRAFLKRLHKEVSDLKDNVADFCKELATDMCGARRAWSATTRAGEATREKPKQRSPRRTLQKAAHKGR